MSTQIPLLFLGDAPSLPTGLGRIGRDLALAVSRLPQYRVAYLGRGGGAHIGSGIADARLPFMQYTYQPTAEDQWGTRVLPDVWQNWAGSDRGVIFTVWDPSRLTWFGNPLRTDDPQYDALYAFLTSGQFERWGYFAIDAMGPGEGGALPHMLAATLRGYDRVLAYSQFGKRVIEASFASLEGTHREGDPDVDWLPHGYNGNAFQPRGREQARARFRLAPDQRLVGCVMSNQPRKDWGLWAAAMRLVKREMPEVVLWAHTDSISRHWDLRILLDAFGLVDCTVVTTDQPSDEEMSWRYSACDVTVLPSLGEGFGYPIVESLACGVPVVHVAYAGGADLFLDKRMLAMPHTYRLDTRYAMMRPVVMPEEFASRTLAALGVGYIRDSMVEHVRHLEWKQLWPRRWQRWWEEGVR